MRLLLLMMILAFGLVGRPALAGSKSLGSSCTNNSDCQSNRCDFANGTYGQKCIPNDGTGQVGDYCSHNNHCRPGVMCINKSCGGSQKKLGESCSSNQDCRSNRCDGAAGNPHNCIPNDGQGQTGDYCTHSNHCRPGVLCRASQCGGSTVSLGSACKLNEDCSSNRCDYANGATGQKCIPNDGTGQVGNYCSHNNHCIPGVLCNNHQCGYGQNPIGATCTNNTACLSGRCDNAAGNPHKCIPNDGQGKTGEYCSHSNQCKPSVLCRNGQCGGSTVSLGTSCKLNEDCSSNRCDYANGATGQKCIPNDGTGQVGNYCSHNNHCIPGVLCNNHQCGYGQNSIGASCTNNAACLSGRCDNAAGNPHKCIPNDGHGKTGEYCSHSNQCTPGVLCRNGQCGGSTVSLGSTCKLNEDCSSNRCDYAAGNPRKCIPNDGTGVKGNYCSHNNQCQAGTWLCIEKKCDTPIANGGACKDNSVCGSGCCSGGACASGDHCYQVWNAVCDVLTAGTCSIVSNSVTEIQGLIDYANTVKQKLESLANKVSNLATTLAQAMGDMAKRIGAEGKQALQDVARDGKSTAQLAKTTLSDNATRSKNLLQTFQQNGPALCAPQGKQPFAVTLGQMVQANAKLASLQQDALQMSLKPIVDTEQFAAQQLEAEMKLQLNIAKQSIETSTKAAGTSMLNSIQLAMAPLLAFLKDPFETLTNPIGTIRTQLDATIAFVSKELDNVDKAFLGTAQTFETAIVGKIKIHRDDVLRLSQQANDMISMSNSLMTQMTSVAGTCSANDAIALASTAGKANPTKPTGAVAGSSLSPTSGLDAALGGARHPGADSVWSAGAAETFKLDGAALSQTMTTIQKRSALRSTADVTRSKADSELNQMCAGKSAGEIEQAKTRLRNDLQVQFKALPWMVDGLMRKFDKDCAVRASRPAQAVPVAPALRTAPRSR
jgi:hypothetical protein